MKAQNELGSPGRPRQRIRRKSQGRLGRPANDPCQHQHGEQGVGAPRDDAVHSNLRRGRSLFIGGAGIESHCPGEEHPSQAQELRPD